MGVASNVRFLMAGLRLVSGTNCVCVVWVCGVCVCVCVVCGWCVGVCALTTSLRKQDSICVTMAARIANVQRLTKSTCPTLPPVLCLNGIQPICVRV